MARDRLQGMKNTFPDSLEILELLGDVYFRMGDWPEAGHYWFPTERTGADVELALRAYHERFGADASPRLRRLLARLPKEKLGPVGATRINTVLAKPPRAAEQLPHQKCRDPEPPRLPRQLWRERIRYWAALIILLVPWMAGLFTLGLWLAARAFPSIGWLLRKWLFPLP